MRTTIVLAILAPLMEAQDWPLPLRDKPRKDAAAMAAIDREDAATLAAA